MWELVRVCCGFDVVEVWMSGVLLILQRWMSGGLGTVTVR